MILNNTCPKCRELTSVEVNEDKYVLYLRDNMLVTEAFPDLTAEEREIIITGLCLDCQMKIVSPGLYKLSKMPKSREGFREFLTNFMLPRIGLSREDRGKSRVAQMIVALDHEVKPPSSFIAVMALLDGEKELSDKDIERVENSIKEWLNEVSDYI